MRRTITRTMLTMIAGLTLLSGCSGLDFEVIGVEGFRQRWEASASNSAVSWWYAGEDSQYYHVVEKWPLEQHGYKIAKDEITLRVAEQRSPPLEEREWSNLKNEQVSFP